MKIAKNNRDEKIAVVESLVGNQILEEDELIKLTTEYIVTSKRLKGAKGNSPFLEGTKQYKKAWIDSYERALASVLLYCFKNEIKSSIGYLYFIESESHKGYVKIGYSQDVETRLNTYQTCSPHRDFKIVKYLILKNPEQAEKIALNLLSHKSVGGEWIKTEDAHGDFKAVCRFLGSIGVKNRFAI